MDIEAGQIIKVGDTVMTIKGPRVVISMNKEVVRFIDGFAPIDRVLPVSRVKKDLISGK